MRRCTRQQPADKVARDGAIRVKLLQLDERERPMSQAMVRFEVGRPHREPL
jgi:hypothetical protein